MSKWLTRYQIKGKSMEPSYNDGDHVIAWKFGKIRENDVIVFKKNALTMIKRVEKIERNINQNRYIVKGDNWQESDENLGAIEKSEILGKVIMKC